MTEYLIRLFNSDYKLATLSRGYGRETKGFLEAGSPELRVKNQESRARNEDSPLTTHRSPLSTHLSPLATQIGDEPAQFKRKFPDVTVAVCEDRVVGIKQLMPDHDLILMDDSYQHRAVVPGLSILLFDYNRINGPQLLLPAGNLREPFSGRWRAQVIIVSKCPHLLTNDEQEALAQKVEPLPYQTLFFTSIAYQPLQDMEGNPSDVIIDSDTTVFLLTGIANPKPLVKHLNGLTTHIIHHKYPDHHLFTSKNIAKLADAYEGCTSQKKIIITTEKDAQRLESSLLNTGFDAEKKLPVFVMPICVTFLNDSGSRFDKIVKEYVTEHTEHHSIH
jgi:tetraacyldisaccharide 4'-kinase